MEEEILQLPDQDVEVVDIQFRPGQKIYFFDPNGAVYHAGDHVIIDTARGAEYGICTGGNHKIPPKDVVAPLRCVLRLATAQDEKTILDDFALTNLSNQSRINAMVSAAKIHTDDESELKAVASLAGVSVPRMQKVFDLAQKESGSMLAFVQEKIGLSDAEVNQLREMYLEPWRELP